MLSYLFFITFLATQSWGKINEYLCNNGIAGPLPSNLIPSNYSAHIRSFDGNTNTSALFHEVKLPGQLWLNRVTRNGEVNFGMGGFNVTFNETSCRGFTNLSSVDALYTMYGIPAKALNFHGFSISQLLEEVVKKNFSQKTLIQEPVEINGIEGIKWVGCDNITESNTTLQVEVIFSGMGSIQPYSASVKNPLLLSVRVSLFNANTTEFYNATVFDLVELEIPAKFENQMPVGVYCTDMQKEIIPSTFPSLFEATFSYRRNSENAEHSLEVYYDVIDRVISFRADVTQHGMLPFLGNVSSFAKDHQRLNLVHDFTYGFEYMLDEAVDVCYPVSAINAGFKDVRLINESSKEIDMKSGDDLFLNLTQSSFYFAGKRSINGVELNVYVSEAHANKESEVIELLFFDLPTKKNTMKNGLHSVVRYQKDADAKTLFTTYIQLNSFHDLTGLSPHVNPISVESCLSYGGNASFYASLKDVSLSNLARMGLARVKTALRGAIAAKAGVSSLRISNIFFKESGKNVLAVFSISDSTKQAPAKTKDLKIETSLEEALAVLNTTLSKQDIEVIIEGTKKVVISQSTLQIVPENWVPLPPPSPSFSGYTGGSMFVLAVFMLVLGGAIGAGIVVFLWKRQRIGTLAYQVFE